METVNADVAIVGYGPVGRMLAVMLAEKGHSVVVVERQKTAYPLPRAVCMDHEIFRALHAHRCEGAIGSYCEPSPRYQWFGQDWSLLVDIDWTVESISGGPEAHFFYQPALEAAIEARLKQLGGVTVLTEHEALDFDQYDEGVDLQIEDRVRGGRRRIRVKYLVGADGANSSVRRALDIGWTDLGFNADFLVVDVAVNPGVKLDVPTAGQFCNPGRPTTFVPGGIKDGRTVRRWEFMLMPGETRQDFENEASAWRLLERWVRPDQGDFLRHAVYTFRSLVAKQWSKGRVYLAGDAAHLTPPFLGQGMCSGMRDAVNLGWRLDLVLRGACASSLLDAYETERKPHITRLIEIAMYLGRIICVADPEHAAERDRSFIERTAPPPPDLPYLIEGTLQADSAQAGRLSPHAVIGTRGGEQGLDQFTGPFFVLLARDRALLDSLSPDHRAAMRRLGVKALYLSTAGDASEQAVVDVTGKFGAYLDAHGLDAYLARPDGYLFGSVARGARLSDLIAALDSKAPARATASAPVMAASAAT